jgi:hypothetical protein
MRGFYHPAAGNPEEMENSDRHETTAERMDRLFGDLLQELRVMQTGAQLTSGFLLTLPFQSRFSELGTFDKSVYLVLVALSLITTALVMSAVAVHQRLSGRYVKDRVVAVGRRLLSGVLVSLALLVAGIGFFVFHIVTDLPAAIAIGVALAVLLIGLLVVLPRTLLRRDPGDR